jgi:hypothetical protein
MISFAVCDIANEAARLKELMISSGDRLQMVWIYAAAVYARMVKFQPLRNRPFCQLIRNNVSVGNLCSIPGVAVTR